MPFSDLTPTPCRWWAERGCGHEGIMARQWVVTGKGLIGWSLQGSLEGPLVVIGGLGGGHRGGGGVYGWLIGGPWSVNRV